ncbi:MAG: type II toxin-antitoxin system death-on-curing family toxin [Methylacidiphilales bacterium]|nr:type II toxin-antitoxin system death-on-curing family toxin [Candidatus Methylacidiphilales bacterium]
MILAYGGSDGVRDPGLVESAVAQGENTFHYGRADLFGIATAYAFHIAENQAFIDGNKRTGAATALSFLHINGVDIVRISSDEIYEMMIKIATKLAELLRTRLA